MAFLHLSGLEVNQAIYDKIERFSVFIRQQLSQVQKLKSLAETALANSLAMNNRKARFFKQISSLETLLAESLVTEADEEHAPGEGLDFLHRS